MHRYSLEKAKAVKAALAAADESGASGEERAAAVAAAEERVLRYRTRAMTALDAVEAALDAAGGSGYDADRVLVWGQEGWGFGGGGG